MRRAGCGPPYGCPIHFSNSQNFQTKTTIFKPKRPFAPCLSHVGSRLAARRARVVEETSAHRGPDKAQRACGMPGARCTRSLARKKGSHVRARVFTAEAPENPAIPHAMCYNLYRALLGEVLIAPVALRIKVLSAPGWADWPPQDLTPASGAGPHGFVVRFSIVRPARPLPAHRLTLMAARPANSDHARYRRVHRISSRVRDDRETPLVWDETNEGMRCFERKVNRNIFHLGAGQDRNTLAVESVTETNER